MSNKLREIRFIKRVSQWLLAKETGIPQSRISLIENNLVRPKDTEIKLIAKTLGLKEGEIFGEQGEKRWRN